MGVSLAGTSHPRTGAEPLSGRVLIAGSQDKGGADASRPLGWPGLPRDTASGERGRQVRRPEQHLILRSQSQACSRPPRGQLWLPLRPWTVRNP